MCIRDRVINISIEENINPTLFFSKKSQKSFLMLALEEGLEDALSKITSWRSSLIRDPLNKILKGY